MEVSNETNSYCDTCISFNIVKKYNHIIKGMVWKKNNPDKVKIHQKNRKERIKEAKKTPHYINNHKLKIKDRGNFFEIKYMKNYKQIKIRRKYGRRVPKEIAFIKITEERNQLMKELFNIDL